MEAITEAINTAEATNTFPVIPAINDVDVAIEWAVSLTLAGYNVSVEEAAFCTVADHCDPHTVEGLYWHLTD